MEKLLINKLFKKPQQAHFLYNKFFIIIHIK